LDKNCNFPEGHARPFIERVLRNGDGMLLLDGLDEVEVSKREALVAEIERVASQYSKSRIVVSCRTADYRHPIKQFDEVELADFSTKQASDFIKQWFSDDSDRSEKLLSIYRKSENIRELCSIPIMAAMMCVLFEYNLRLPENRADLYSGCIDALLFRWDSERSIVRESNFSNLSTPRKNRAFAKSG